MTPVPAFVDWSDDLDTESDTSSFLERLDRVRTLDTWWSVCVRQFRLLGIDFVTYRLYRAAAFGTGHLAWTTLPAWWRAAHVDAAPPHDDPFFRQCASFAPKKVGVEYLDQYPVLTEAERRFLQGMARAGMISGVASPVRLAGQDWVGGWIFGSSLGRQPFEAFYARIGLRACLLGFYAHEVLERLRAMPQAGPGDDVLSRREAECLGMLANGLRTARIADRMGVTPVTVEYHVRNARRKLGATTREEALATSIRRGLLRL